MKNNSVLNKKVFFSIFLIDLIFCGLYGLCIQNNLIKLGILFIILLIICPILIIIYKITIQIFKNKRKIIATLLSIFVISIILLVIGVSIFFSGTPFEGIYTVDKVNVISSTWNSVEIDYSKYNHNDYKTITIRKPFFVKVEKGDTIQVRYYINHPEKMSYVLDTDIGLSIMGISILIFEVLICISVVGVVYLAIRKVRERK